MYRIAACLLALLPAAAVSAQADLASKMINDPSAPQVTGAKAQLIDDAGVQGGKALRIVVARKGKNTWDSVIESPIGKGIKAGDKLLILLEARLEKGVGGATVATVPYIAVQQIAAPYSGVVSGQASLGPQWKQYRIEGRADRDYAPNALKTTIQVGNAKQTIDLGPVMVFNMGQ